jgi:2EXR family
MATTGLLTAATASSRRLEQFPQATFSSLPPEVREMIWLDSFEIRAICLHIHHLLESPHLDTKETDLNISEAHVAISFVCTILLATNRQGRKHREATAPDGIFPATVEIC